MAGWKDLGTLLVEYGLLNNADIDEGLRLHKESGLRLGEALVKLGKVSMEEIEWVLSKQLDIPFVIVDDINLNIDLLGKFQKEFLIENRILPLNESDDQVSIVLEDPFNKAAVSFIEDNFGKQVSMSTGSGSKIEEILKQAFKKVGPPELIDSIKTIIEKIRETSFYRIDFVLAEHSCRINAFGAGILIHLEAINGQYSNEDVFRAFNELNIRFIYEQSFSDNRRFLAVYPLINSIDMVKLPAIIGMYGLVIPGETVFSNACVNGFSSIFHLGKPVHGYPYLSTTEMDIRYEKCIYAVDAAPAEFKEFYVNTYIPKTCRSCRGTGCETCNDLGYRFDKIEGIYSSNELKERMGEDQYGKN